MIGREGKYPFDRILAFILVGLLVIPASAAWSEEFRRWYFEQFNVRKNPAAVRLSYAVFITFVAIAGVYLLYYFTDLFSLT